MANQDSWLDFTGAAAGKSGFAVLVAFKVDSTPTNGASRNIVIANHGNPAGNASFALKYEAGYPTVYIGSGTSNPQYINYNPAAAIQAGDTLVFAFNYEAATGFWGAPRPTARTTPPRRAASTAAASSPANRR